MLRGLLLLFVLVPLVELYLLTLIARATSFWWAVALTVVTGVAGGSLAKREGLRVWRRWQAALNQMRVPEEGVVDGLLILVGGVLLITPGVLTDITGFVLVLPQTRRLVAQRLRRRIDARFTTVSLPRGFSDPHAPGRSPTSRGAIETSGTSLDA